MSLLEDYEPKAVFRYFEEIAAIPHGSKNTKQISDYLVAFAKKHGFEYEQDAMNNVIIIKEATKGYEDAPSLIIQGHIDMVCEQVPGGQQDFLNDGLQLQVEGDFISAKGTTLGGDDGIAVAYALAVLDSDTLEHPRLEVVLTSDEEIGLLGAVAIDLSRLQGKRLLNIDSEEEGYLLTSCAGGSTAICNTPVEYHMQSGLGYIISVEGLLGGHSGMEIDKQRGNASILMGRLLYELGLTIPFDISSLAGGSKNNAIPRNAQVRIIIDELLSDTLEELLSEYKDTIRHEYKASDPDVTVTYERLDFMKDQVLTPISKEKVVFQLMTVPNGIQRMSCDIEGLVETSLNLGICQLTNEGLFLEFGVRSSIESSKKALCDKLQYIVEFLGGEFFIEGDYPGWEYKRDSKLREIMVAAYVDLYGKEPVIQAIHAGLECGVFCSKIEDLDCVSFGPDMYGVHTFEEKISISSTDRVWRYLTEVLRRCR